MLNHLSLRCVILIFTVLFLRPVVSHAVRPVEDIKEFHIDDELTQKKKISVFDKFILRKFLKKAKRSDESFDKLQSGHWSLILAGASILLFGIAFGLISLFPLLMLGVFLLGFATAIAAIMIGFISRKDKKEEVQSLGHTAGIIGTILGFASALMYVLSGLVVIAGVIILLLSL